MNKIVLSTLVTSFLAFQVYASESAGAFGADRKAIMDRIKRSGGVALQHGFSSGEVKLKRSPLRQNHVESPSTSPSTPVGPSILSPAKPKPESKDAPKENEIKTYQGNIPRNPLKKVDVPACMEQPKTEIELARERMKQNRNLRQGEQFQSPLKSTAEELKTDEGSEKEDEVKVSDQKNSSLFGKLSIFGGKATGATVRNFQTKKPAKSPEVTEKASETLSANKVETESELALGKEALKENNVQDSLRATTLAQVIALSSNTEEITQNKNDPSNEPKLSPSKNETEKAEPIKNILEASTMLDQSSPSCSPKRMASPRTFGQRQIPKTSSPDVELPPGKVHQSNPINMHKTLVCAAVRRKTISIENLESCEDQAQVKSDVKSDETEIDDELLDDVEAKVPLTTIETQNIMAEKKSGSLTTRFFAEIGINDGKPAVLSEIITKTENIDKEGYEKNFSPASTIKSEEVEKPSEDVNLNSATSQEIIISQLSADAKKETELENTGDHDITSCESSRDQKVMNDESIEIQNLGRTEDSETLSTDLSVSLGEGKEITQDIVEEEKKFNQYTVDDDMIATHDSVEDKNEITQDIFENECEITHGCAQGENTTSHDSAEEDKESGQDNVENDIVITQEIVEDESEITQESFEDESKITHDIVELESEISHDIVEDESEFAQSIVENGREIIRDIAEDESVIAHDIVEDGNEITQEFVEDESEITQDSVDSVKTPIKDQEICSTINSTLFAVVEEFEQRNLDGLVASEMANHRKMEEVKKICGSRISFVEASKIIAKNHGNGFICHGKYKETQSDNGEPLANISQDNTGSDTEENLITAAPGELAVLESSALAKETFISEITAANGPKCIEDLEETCIIFSGTENNNGGDESVDFSDNVGITDEIFLKAAEISGKTNSYGDANGLIQIQESDDAKITSPTTEAGGDEESVNEEDDNSGEESDFSNINFHDVLFTSSTTEAGYDDEPMNQEKDIEPIVEKFDVTRINIEDADDSLDLSQRKKETEETFLSEHNGQLQIYENIVTDMPTDDDIDSAINSKTDFHPDEAQIILKSIENSDDESTKGHDSETVHVGGLSDNIDEEEDLESDDILVNADKDAALKAEKGFHTDEETLENSDEESAKGHDLETIDVSETLNDLSEEKNLEYNDEIDVDINSEKEIKAQIVSKSFENSVSINEHDSETVHSTETYSNVSEPEDPESNNIPSNADIEAAAINTGKEIDAQEWISSENSDGDSTKGYDSTTIHVQQGESSDVLSEEKVFEISYLPSVADEDAAIKAEKEINDDEAQIILKSSTNSDQESEKGHELGTIYDSETSKDEEMKSNEMIKSAEVSSGAEQETAKNLIANLTELENIKSEIFVETPVNSCESLIDLNAEIIKALNINEQPEDLITLIRPMESALDEGDAQNQMNNMNENEDRDPHGSSGQSDVMVNADHRKSISDDNVNHLDLLAGSDNQKISIIEESKNISIDPIDVSLEKLGSNKEEIDFPTAPKEHNLSDTYRDALTTNDFPAEICQKKASCIEENKKAVESNGIQWRLLKISEGVMIPVLDIDVAKNIEIILIGLAAIIILIVIASFRSRKSAKKPCHQNRSIVSISTDTNPESTLETIIVVDNGIADKEVQENETIIIVGDIKEAEKGVADITCTETQS